VVPLGADLYLDLGGVMPWEVLETKPQESHLLGRNRAHHSGSRSFALADPIDRSLWRSMSIRLYDPYPNPRQRVGCCTGCATSMMLNAVGNRVRGRVLDMEDGERLYSWASRNDPWEGAWPPEDTGSSGLAAAQAAQFYGYGGQYEWEFRGADGVIQNVQAGRVMSVGTWWYADMMDLPATRMIAPTGGIVGGHQYVIRGYDKYRDAALGRCWWGAEFRDFWIKRTHLDDLLRDGGDAHWQRTA
jgi:hypothetical protein